MAYDKHSLNYITQSYAAKIILAQVEAITDLIAAEADKGKFELEYHPAENILDAGVIDFLTNVGLFLEADVEVGASVVGLFTRAIVDTSYVYTAASGVAQAGVSYFEKISDGLGYTVTKKPLSEFSELEGVSKYNFNSDLDYYYVNDLQEYKYVYNGKDWTPSGNLFEKDQTSDTYFESSDPVWIAGKVYYEKVGDDTYSVYDRPDFYIKEVPYYIISWM